MSFLFLIFFDIFIFLEYSWMNQIWISIDSYRCTIQNYFSAYDHHMQKYYPYINQFHLLKIWIGHLKIEWMFFFYLFFLFLCWNYCLTVLKIQLDFNSWMVSNISNVQDISLPYMLLLSLMTFHYSFDS
jgi:hypothetical protein